VHYRFYVHTVNEYDAGPQPQNSSHGGDHDDGSIETKQQPTSPIIVQIAQIVLLIIAYEISSSLMILVVS
jgi:hypothetical protein